MQTAGPCKTAGEAVAVFDLIVKNTAAFRSWTVPVRLPNRPCLFITFTCCAVLHVFYQIFTVFKGFVSFSNNYKFPQIFRAYSTRFMVHEGEKV